MTNRKSDPTAPLSARLRERRIRAGLTQEQLAVYAGVTARTIQHIEADNGRRPYRGTLLLIANTLGCDVADLEPEKEAA